MRRFWEKADKTETCWLWTAAIDAKGYGRFRLDGHNHRAHRVAYELAIGPIPEGLTIDHLCRTRNCVNPEHLEAVSMRENVLRGEGLPAQNAAATHCPAGHPFNAENTYLRIRGRRTERHCRTCKRDSERARYRRRTHA